MIMMISAAVVLEYLTLTKTFLNFSLSDLFADFNRYQQQRAHQRYHEQNHQLKGFDDDGDDRLSTFRRDTTGSLTTDGEGN